ncbi:type I polyketide synthase [Actinomadura sp. 6N118]|uniref:type I polyketide synthase n=1 Tax=Actinomadura sp. 6N118 TaxID=3375151 RepID=UPI0037A88AE5
MDLRTWMVERVAAYAATTPAEIDVDRPFDEYGLRSRDAVAISGELADHLGRDIPDTMLWEHPTIRLLSAHLQGEEAAPSGSTAGPGSAGDRAAIAVIGIGCRLPGGIGSPADLWSFLCAGRDAISEVPAERWAGYRSRSAAAAAVVDSTTPFGGYLDDVTGFDARFFGIAPAEAAEMDPQQRIFLEVAWEALEHAGIAPELLAGDRSGVFVGACSDDFGRRRLEEVPDVTGWTLTGSAPGVIANRLSYLLDLRGPSLTIDTACSSSLVALHTARQNLMSGDCDLAIVGGVNLLLSPGPTAGFDQSGAMAADGRCKPFDVNADGYVRSEGCGVIVAKRLADAARDGDRVLAVIRGSAVNQDGRSNGLMAPSPGAQQDLLRRAYAAAKADAMDIGYVEAHGTGTPLGDPIEASALGTVLGGRRPAEDPLLIGSIKSNLGHLEAAAGIAGLIKVVLALHHGRIPATIHHAEPNPRISLPDLGLRVPTEVTEWPVNGRPRLAGVSSFGFGGTNAHAVLENFR